MKPFYNGTDSDSLQSERVMKEFQSKIQKLLNDKEEVKYDRVETQKANKELGDIMKAVKEIKKQKPIGEKVVGVGKRHRITEFNDFEDDLPLFADKVLGGKRSESREST